MAFTPYILMSEYGSTTKILSVECPVCKNFFAISEWQYNHRLERNQGRGVYCSSLCGHKDLPPVSEETRKKLSEANIKRYENDGISHIVNTNCATCGKDVTLERWEYNARIARSDRQQIFCSIPCSLIDRPASEETRKKISESQKGISVATRGRIGHTVSAETKKKISESKRANNKHVVSDWEIVRKAAKDEGLANYVTTQAPLPDNLFVTGCTCGKGRVAGMEVEKKPHFTAVQKKMEMYRMNTSYGKVVLRWYNLQGEFQKRWVYENGSWTLTS